ncbi:unnamed protein product [Sphagnum balticum]
MHNNSIRTNRPLRTCSHTMPYKWATCALPKNSCERHSILIHCIRVHCERCVPCGVRIGCVRAYALPSHTPVQFGTLPTPTEAPRIITPTASTTPSSNSVGENFCVRVRGSDELCFAYDPEQQFLRSAPAARTKKVHTFHRIEVKTSLQYTCVPPPPLALLILPLLHSTIDQSLAKRLLDMVEWHVYKRHQQWARVRQMAIIEEQAPVVFDEEIVDSTGEVRARRPICIEHTSSSSRLAHSYYSTVTPILDEPNIHHFSPFPPETDVDKHDDEQSASAAATAAGVALVEDAAHRAAASNTAVNNDTVDSDVASLDSDAITPEVSTRRARPMTT